MAELTPENAKRLRQLADRLMEQASSLDESYSKHVEGLIGFNDKLFLLNGTTLTLSFTVVSAFASHIAGKSQALHLSCLIWAWWLLVSSLSLS